MKYEICIGKALLVTEKKKLNSLENLLKGLKKIDEEEKKKYYANLMKCGKENNKSGFCFVVFV